MFWEECRKRIRTCRTSFPKNRMDDDDSQQQQPVPLPHHKLSLELRKHPVRGRGVFCAAGSIPQNTLVEVSPILLFTSDEYEQHGKFTIADHYTYRWQGGYALALGLGSMFNHSSKPNVGFIRDFKNGVIRYVTLREVKQDEELCISYGSNLWFECDDDEQNTAEESEDDEDLDAEWLGHISL